MSKELNLTPEIIIEAIKGSGSIMSTIADRLGISWHAARKYINLYEETKIAYADEEETILDKAESVIFNSIEESKDLQSAKWLLSTKGKKRGYSGQLEIDHGLNKESINEFAEIAENFRKKVNGDN
jgi:hypothetical protein